MRQGPMGERDTWKYSERWTDRLQATGMQLLAYMAQPPLATLRQYIVQLHWSIRHVAMCSRVQETCRHVQQSAGDMLPCAAECRRHVAMCSRVQGACRHVLEVWCCSSWPPLSTSAVSAGLRRRQTTSCCSAVSPAPSRGQHMSSRGH